MRQAVYKQARLGVSHVAYKLVWRCLPHAFHGVLRRSASHAFHDVLQQVVPQVFHKFPFVLYTLGEGHFPAFFLEVLCVQTGVEVALGYHDTRPVDVEEVPPIPVVHHQLRALLPEAVF